MDRPVVFVGEIPLDTDFLFGFRATMIALGRVLQATIGTVIACDGLPCTPTTPASMSVVVGPGSMMVPSVVDQNPYGSLPADPSDPLVKMGINLGSTTFPITAPTQAGYSVVWMIQGQMVEAFTGSVVLPYVNAANPLQPFSGPGGNGAAQSNRLTQSVALTLVEGVPAPTGTQTTPAPTPGCTPLWLITVQNGQATIVAANITMADGAPFIGNKLSEQRTFLQGPTTFYVSPQGNDNNSGRLPGPSSAWQTLTGAYNNIVSDYDCNGYPVTVQVEAGNYAPLVAIGSPLGLGGNGYVSFVGQGATSIIQSSGVNGTVNAENGAFVTVSDFVHKGTHGIQPLAGSGVTVGPGNVFTNIAGNCIYANGGSVLLTAAGSFTVNSSCAAVLSTNDGGTIFANSGTIINTPAPLTVGTAFASAYSGIITAAGMLFANGGNVSGPKYSAQFGGGINTGGGGASFFPGSVAGSLGQGSSTGFYA